MTRSRFDTMMRYPRRTAKIANEVIAGISILLFLKYLDCPFILTAREADHTRWLAQFDLRMLAFTPGQNG
jgi:hypothetical protein